MDSATDDCDKPDAIKQAILQRSVHVLAPLVRLLLHYGVDYPSLAAALKRAFLNEGVALLQNDAQPLTHTALSLLTGLHRGDVKALLQQPAAQLPARATAPTLPVQALARWTSDPRYCDADGEPLTLPLRSTDPDIPTFEELALSVSKSVHPTSLVDELVRLGFVRFDGRFARVINDSFVPRGEASYMHLLDALAGSTHDHLAAAVANVLAKDQRFLEYSLIADELRPESAEELHALVRRLGKGAYKKALNAAASLVERDRPRGFADAQETRIRFGMYFYAEPKQGAAQAAPIKTDEGQG